MIPRGLRNKNPGNIRWGEPWRGLVPKEKRTDREFCQFTDDKFGIRALSKVLTTYYNKYGLDTPRSIINRYAPPEENDSGSYALAVAKHLGVHMDDVINFDSPEVKRKLIEAIIKHENGQQPYPAALIDEAMRLA